MAVPASNDYEPVEAVAAAREALDQGQWSVGTHHAESVLQADPSHLEAGELLVEAHQGGGRHDLAVVVGESLLANHGTSLEPTLVIRIAAAYEHTGRVTQALRLIDRHIDERPDATVFTSARADIVARLSSAADAGTLPEPPRLPTKRAAAKPSTPLPVGTSADETTRDEALPQPSAPTRVSWLVIAAGLLIGAGLALFALVLLT